MGFRNKSKDPAVPPPVPKRPPLPSDPYAYVRVDEYGRYTVRWGVGYLSYGQRTTRNHERAIRIRDAKFDKMKRQADRVSYAVERLGEAEKWSRL